MRPWQATSGCQRLIGDLVRGMLAEDPEHRPPPALLLDPASARAVALPRGRLAGRRSAITLAGSEVWDARSLALALAVDPARRRARSARRCR